MSKTPAFQFYPADWALDLEEHPLEIEGAWIRIIGRLWRSDTRGKMSKTLTQWSRILSRILRVTEDKALEILRYIQKEKIGDISSDLTEPNGYITVINRRMVRDEKDRENNRKRQQRHYNEELTPPSSSSSSRDNISSDILSSVQSDSDHSGPPVLTIPLINKSEFEIFQEDVDQWKESFPAVDVLQTLRTIRQWNIDNPTRRKTIRGIRKHISGWLAREQDRGGRPAGSFSKTRDQKLLGTFQTLAGGQYDTTGVRSPDDEAVFDV